MMKMVHFKNVQCRFFFQIMLCFCFKCSTFSEISKNELFWLLFSLFFVWQWKANALIKKAFTSAQGLKMRFDVRVNEDILLTVRQVRKDQLSKTCEESGMYQKNGWLPPEVKQTKWWLNLSNKPLNIGSRNSKLLSQLTDNVFKMF